MSIKQNPSLAGHRREGRWLLPDFRNLGAILRILLLVNGLAMAAVLARNGELAQLAAEVMDMAVVIELPLILSVAGLFLLQPLLRRVPVPGALAAAAAVVLAVTALVHGLLQPFEAGSLPRWLAWALVALACVLAYFRVHAAAYSPALAEARLLALTARIRPHFLFNSLNGVLGILRSDPRRAEEGLEELSDLFRALMQDNRDLVPLADEIALCERYLSLERLRLGERLVVRWERDADTAGAFVPPLFLQPLVENAVYHGIEPGAGPGEVRIAVRRRGAQVLVEVSNPLQDKLSHHAGNRMAVDNIRERLMLFFDLEAALETERKDGQYQVRIRLPYRSQP